MRRGMIVTISKLRDRVYNKLKNASNDQWREVFRAFDMSLVVNQADEGIVLAVPGETQHDKRLNLKLPITIKRG